MAGTVIVDTINSSVSGTPPVFQANGTQIGTLCRAWVNFDGTGTFSPNPSTTKIRASFNVSSITDNGTGDYTVNFTTAMPDANYSWAGSAQILSALNVWIVGNPNSVAPTTTALRIKSTQLSGANTDTDYVDIQVFR